MRQQAKPSNKLSSGLKKKRTTLNHFEPQKTTLKKNEPLKTTPTTKPRRLKAKSVQPIAIPASGTGQLRDLGEEAGGGL